ncbi:DUF2147 domain-containing protein [Spirosoma pollinicola]|uniref:DUF2147 domain-containing protein n=1 Tax=Spirosoma pollinicola TaxID=2057025 RepID=A0A2K8Z8H2_9BACT|nr:DUF2147 domain-containing protein [Spirosoma pollinicola]AUD06150.1 DUF2147 domain-containing protein [Spirosoma pollinicola]
MSHTSDMAQPSILAKINPDEVIGTWVSEGQDSKMEIYKSGNTYCDRLLAGWGNKLYEKDGKTLKKDTKNPDNKLRNRPLLNMEFITDLRYEGGEYTGCNLYVAQLGRTVSCKMKFNQRTLVMRAYVGFPLLGMIKKWTRVI